MTLFRLFATIGFVLLMSGCTSLDRPNKPSPQPQARVVQPPAPVVPEIRASRPPRVIKPYAYSGAKRVIKRPSVVVKPKPKPKLKYQAPKYKAPKVQRYPGAPSKQTKIVSPATPAVIPPVNKNTKAEAPEDEGLDIDPYANIPDNADDRGTGRSSNKASSPAIEALLVRAYADAKLGRTDAAMSKLERGLRIEPQNPKLWYQLAELHYQTGDYQQAITMAKKAINFSSNDRQMTDKNWRLIGKVATKSGNSRVMSEVNEYNKRR